jgi:hypothetical protein
MELLDRYLDAVRFWLPAAQQADIIAELGDDIRSQIEESEASLGRQLSEDDLAALLKQYGHPMLAAGRYLPQRSLIGPVLYPAYLLVLRIVVLWVLVPVFVLIVAPLAIATGVSPIAASVETVWNLLMAAVFSVGVVTVVFAILERSPRQDFLKWDPRKWPRLPQTKPIVDTGAGPIPRATAAAELIFSLIFTGFCIQAAWYRAGFDLNVVHVALAPVWEQIYFPVLAVFAAGIVTGWTSLVWPLRTRLRATVRLATDVLVFIVLIVLTKAGSWFILTSSKLSDAQLAGVTKATGLGMKIALASAAIITLIDVVQEIRRYYGANGPVIDIRR